MKYAEINKKFTAAVAGYLAQGYTFNTATMTGSQGERSRVDLTNGTEIITIYLNKFSSWTYDADLSGWELVVARPCQKDELTPNEHSGYRTLWLAHVEVISVERFYQLGRDDDWFVTEEEAKAAATKQVERYMHKPRWHNSNSVEIENPKARELAKQYLIDHRVAKRVDMNQMQLKKRTEKQGVRFFIAYKGKFYSLH